MANQRGYRGSGDWDRDRDETDDDRRFRRQQGGEYEEREGYGQQRGESFSRGGFGEQGRGRAGFDPAGSRSRQQGGFGSEYGSGDYGERDFGQSGGYGQRGGSSQSGGHEDWSRPSGTSFRDNRGGNRGQSSYGDRSYAGRSGRSGERDLWDRATDEVASWFGDEDAEQRRRQDEHRGRGPKNYARSDERIQEDINDRLTDEGSLDASDIDVSVSSREVTLSGEVANRWDKRRAEDIAEAVSGVTHVQNNIRVRQTMSETSARDIGKAGGTSGRNR